MLKVEDVLKRHDEMKATRLQEEPMWRDIAKFAMPEEREMFNDMPISTRQNTYRDIFDATQLYAVDEFSGGIFGQLTNPANRWFELTLDDTELAKWQPVRDWLWNVASVIYASLSPAVSSFYTEAPAWFQSLGAFGLGSMYQEENEDKGRFTERTIPLGQCYIDCDDDGELFEHHRGWSMKGAKLKRKFPELDRTNYKCNDDADHKVVHAVMPNPQFTPGRLGPDGFPFVSAYVVREIKDWIRVKGYYEMPYHPVMWQRRSSGCYPSGPGHKTTSDVKMLQEMRRSFMVGVQFAGEPPLMTHGENLLTALDVRPNAILPGTITEDGKELAKPLNRAQNLPMVEETCQQVRAAINRGYYFGMMQVLNRPQMTAEEFLGWKQESLQKTAPNLASIQAYGLSPFIARRVRLLQRAGGFDKLPPPPPELEGRRIDIEYVSPLAKLLKVSEGRAVLQYVGSLAQVAEATGDMSVMDNVEGDNAADILRESFSVPPSIRRDPAKVEEIRKGRAMLQQRTAELDQAERGAGVIAELSHADQARTLSRQRANTK